MATLLDTDRLPPSERRPAQVAARLEASMASRVRFRDRHGPTHARLDRWQVGGVTVLRADLTGELALCRSAAQAREDPEPVVSFAVQELGTALQEHQGSQRVVPSGGLSLTEVSSPYEYRWSGRGVCRSLQLPVSRLGLPVDVVRRAVPVVHTSPLFGMVSAHLEQLTRDAEVLSAEPLVGSLASGTIDLTRALLVSAAGPARGAEDALAETLLSQVRGYVRQHLTDPDLDAARVAAALAVSVRQLYRVCATAGFRLEQWVIQQRLEGARAELTDPHSRRPIAAVARRWGFTDASYFSRRFRQEYGMTPRTGGRPGGPSPSPHRGRRPAPLLDTAPRRPPSWCAGDPRRPAAPTSNRCSSGVRRCTGGRGHAARAARRLPGRPRRPVRRPGAAGPAGGSPGRSSSRRGRARPALLGARPARRAGHLARAAGRVAAAGGRLARPGRLHRGRRARPGAGGGVAARRPAETGLSPLST